MWGHNEALCLSTSLCYLGGESDVAAVAHPPWRLPMPVTCERWQSLCDVSGTCSSSISQFICRATYSLILAVACLCC